MRHSTNMQGLNQAKQKATSYPSPPQIACRICEQVFTSNQTLIHHLGYHTKAENLSSSSSRKHHNLTLNLSLGPTSIPKGRSTTTAATGILPNYANPFQTNLYFPWRNNNGSFTFTIGSPQPPEVPPSSVQTRRMAVGQNFAFRPTQKQCYSGQPVAEASDRTMPLLHLLEKQKPGTTVPYNDRCVSDCIDLTLRL